MNLAKYFLILSVFLLTSTTSQAFHQSATNFLALDPEELRIETAQQAIPQQVKHFSHSLNQFKHDLSQIIAMKDAMTVVTTTGLNLWQLAVKQAQETLSYDDRPLYWARLVGRVTIKNIPLTFTPTLSQRDQLLSAWEDASRGITSIDYAGDPSLKRIFLSGFDPFLLDRNIDQSNPSGVAALMLDGKIINYQGQKVQIETVMIPVRFDDFDQGLIERILTPLMAPDRKIDLIATISMGRKDFDLERFPGKRRSATIPGNRNVITGASASNPLVPFLNGASHDGAEFVEFSLPVKLMQQAVGAFKINDNHQVSTLAKGSIKAISLNELTNQVSVQGSGGSYLSNEISYRSIALRDKLASQIAVGHIHTPRIKSFEPKTIQLTVEQITEMLKHASTSFK